MYRVNALLFPLDGSCQSYDCIEDAYCHKYSYRIPSSDALLILSRISPKLTLMHYFILNILPYPVLRFQLAPQDNALYSPPWRQTIG